MNKNNYTTVKLNKGEVSVYDFGAVKLHAYKTNDFIDDEVFIVEKNGQAVIIEAPSFFDNCQELTAYLSDLQVCGMLIAYHAAGGSFMPSVPKFATANAKDFAENGDGKALIDKFVQAFGAAFDGSIQQIDNLIETGKLTLGGVDFIITPTAEAFDVEIPEINAVYTHMLGHDCHSIVAGADHAAAIIEQLNGYIARGYDLILTSHYTPEDLKDAATKIAYLEKLQKLAAQSADAAEFKQAMQREFPAYSGENYLDMTAGFFFD